MKKIIVLFMVTLIGGYSMISISSAEESSITLYMLYTEQSGYHPDELQMIARVFKELSGIEVNIDYSPYEEQYKKITELTSTYDVLAFDQIWLADFASKGLIAPLSEYLTKKLRSDLAPGLLTAFRYQGEAWAFPFLVNFQLLFYNEGMLEKAGFDDPPTTLEELLEQMIALKEQDIIRYPWTDSWQQDEGLICEYVWLTGAFGGEIFDKSGKSTFDQEPGVKALEFMVMLLKEELADPKILTNDAITAKDDFILEQAAFTSNWLFQTGFLEDPQRFENTENENTEDENTENENTEDENAEVPEPRARTMFGLLPASEEISQRTSSVSGLQGIAITAHSEKKDAAWKWISFLTSPLVQRAYLFEMPIWISVQTSKDTEMLDPTMPLKRTQLENAHYRPNISNYGNVSFILQRYLYTALLGQLEPADALEKAKTEIEALLGATTAQ